jgi:hypothetical protein
MHSAHAYQVLARELEILTALPGNELALLVAAAPLPRIIQVGGEDAEIEFTADWSDKAKTRLVVTGHLRGPSTWHHQHFQESITVNISPGAAPGA